MKINWNHIKLIALLLMVCGLYAFADFRSDKKKIETLNVEFLGEQNLYINHETVNKLLIQKYGTVVNVPKEHIVLNTIEKVIEANEMVKEAQVYLTVNSELKSKIVQRQPIGRVEGNAKFYVDDEGKRMPLSKYHSARVPIITGKITGKSLEDVYEILKYINADNFLRKNVIGIHIEDEENYQLKFRMENFVVNLGGVDSLEEKFSNFKAFYTKATKDKTLEDYNIVSLEFNNQVVCTKI
ncbi:cell division protein FtsQ/DivIB [Spongiimicrobium sp. 3-5]|uniref:cell division protein FtsQ/DivIB n=1 Tax=Spongiimicrobium sp. 3-5 TaxID=3332596 RepID=UPI00397F8F6A